MTTFTLSRSYIGVEYEIISTHKWRPTCEQWPYETGTTRADLTKWVVAVLDSVRDQDDRRKSRVYWSPDGKIHIPVETIDQAIALHDTTWMNGAPSADGYVILNGNVVDGISVTGTFASREDAIDYGQDCDDQWCVAEIRGQ